MRAGTSYDVNKRRDAFWFTREYPAVASRDHDYDRKTRGLLLLLFFKLFFTICLFQAIDEMEQRDLPQAFRLLGEMNANVLQVNQLVDNMLVRVKNGEISTDKGLSFLEMKYHMLLSYLINLTYVVLRKCSGERIEGDPSIDRLIEIRTVLEKIRPIDHKLKYQIDKLVKTAVTGTINSDDPNNFRANPDALVAKLDSEDSDSDQEEDTDGIKSTTQQSRKSNVYVPPKLAAVHYGQFLILTKFSLSLYIT